MEPQTSWDLEEPKGKYYKFESLSDGRTVLEPVKVPEHVAREREKKVRERELRRIAEKNRQRAGQLDRKFVFLVGAGIVVCCFTCYVYLSMLFEMKEHVETVSDLEVQVEEAAAENDLLEQRIENAENIAEIEEAAEEELGMSLADEGQIVYYTVPDVDYMLQYEDIE